MLRVGDPKQVRALEEELGGELLERLPRSVRLTSADKAFLPREWVMFDADNGLNDLVVAACATGASPPFMPRPAVLTSQVEAAARRASAGVGPALVPENTLPSDLRPAVVRADPPIGRELTVYARADWTPLGKAFLELMRARPWQYPPLDATVIA